MKNLKKDLQAASGGSFFKAVSCVLLGIGFKAIWRYRIANFMYYKLKLKILPKLISYKAKKRSIDIDYRAKIGPGFRIMHGVGIVVGCNIVTGKNLTLYQNVTLGGNSGKTQVLANGMYIDQPYIGDDVTIAPGSIVIGPVQIGNNSTIGAGSVITKNVSENKIVFCKAELVERDKI